MGRQLAVPEAAGKSCLFSFTDLCSKAVAAADAAKVEYETLQVNAFFLPAPFLHWQANLSFQLTLRRRESLNG